MLRHFNTCFNVLITAFGLSSQTLPWLSTYLQRSPQSGRVISFRPKSSLQSERFLCKSRLIFLPFEAEKTTHRLNFPSLDPVESSLCPRPVFAPETEDAVDVFHHPSTLQSPRHVLASVDFHISTKLCSHSTFSLPSNIAFHLLQSSVFPWRFMVHPRILNFLSQGTLWRPVLVSMERSVLSSKTLVLVYHKLAGFDAKSHFSAS